MKCSECRGACCEEVIIPRCAVTMPDDDAVRWFELRGEYAPLELLEGIELPEAGLRLEVPCTKLTEDGRCGIYEERPNVCAAYEAGGADCLDTVRRRRTPEDYQRIRDPEDPEVIHG